jgi:hypothetical protein
MKTCGKCKLSKNESDFSWKNKSKGTLQSFCKECQKEYRKIHYESNKQYYVDKSAKWRDSERVRFFTWLKKQSCTDCGNKDFRVLEFDHLGDKEFGIAAGIGMMTFESLQTELDKCEVVCANCHRIRTTNRGNHYKYLTNPR